MESLVNLNIGNAFEEVLKRSYELRTLESESKRTDEFLDSINEFKNILERKIKEIELINHLLERLTWIETEINDETLIKINGILGICNGVNLNFQDESQKIVRAELDKICPDIITKFNEQVEILEESINDVEMIFFKLRQDEEFLDLDNQLSNF